ncbi:HD domain-containing protein [Clostridium sp. HBUAS56017]|uniref:HD domain-containing protein n=1 Tax=Clostridium sp. HBUAS56017 TaxID=2571128 RepID=UPI0011779093|nr:HD domain-containing protein [Clostridium sp. HBUAS56017]
MSGKKLYEEIEEHLLKDKKPSIFLNELKDKGILDEYPFSEIKGLEKIQQSPKHHPEGNVWIHTMMVVDEGAKVLDEVKDKRSFMWCLLLHDLGKLTTTKLRKGRWISYDHDKVGEEEGRKFLSYFIDDEKFIVKTIKLIRYHMHLLYVMGKMPYSDIEGMKRYTDLDDLSMVFLSDRLGRGGLSDKDKEEVRNEIKKFKEKYGKIQML